LEWTHSPDAFAGRNVMLQLSDVDERGFVAKVCDFGLAHEIGGEVGDLVRENVLGTISHVSPEQIVEGKVVAEGGPSQLSAPALGDLLTMQFSKSVVFDFNYFQSVLTLVCVFSSKRLSLRSNDIVPRIFKIYALHTFTCHTIVIFIARNLMI
jgi:serine/threonine protein kinase